MSRLWRSSRLHADNTQQRTGTTHEARHAPLAQTDMHDNDDSHDEHSDQAVGSTHTYDTTTGMAQTSMTLSDNPTPPHRPHDTTQGTDVDDDRRLDGDAHDDMTDANDNTDPTDVMPTTDDDGRGLLRMMTPDEDDEPRRRNVMTPDDDDDEGDAWALLRPLDELDDGTADAHGVDDDDDNAMATDDNNDNDQDDEDDSADNADMDDDDDGADAAADEHADNDGADASGTADDGNDDDNDELTNDDDHGNRGGTDDGDATNRQSHVADSEDDEDALPHQYHAHTPHPRPRLIRRELPAHVRAEMSPDMQARVLMSDRLSWAAGAAPPGSIAATRNPRAGRFIAGGDNCFTVAVGNETPGSPQHLARRRTHTTTEHTQDTTHTSHARTTDHPPDGGDYGHTSDATPRQGFADTDRQWRQRWYHNQDRSGRRQQQWQTGSWRSQDRWHSTDESQWSSTWHSGYQWHTGGDATDSSTHQHRDTHDTSASSSDTTQTQQAPPQHSHAQQHPQQATSTDDRLTIPTTPTARAHLGATRDDSAPPDTQAILQRLLRPHPAAPTQQTLYSTATAAPITTAAPTSFYPRPIGSTPPTAPPTTAGPYPTQSNPPRDANPPGPLTQPIQPATPPPAHLLPTPVTPEPNTLRLLAQALHIQAQLNQSAATEPTQPTLPPPPPPTQATPIERPKAKSIPPNAKWVQQSQAPAHGTSWSL